MTPLSLCLLLVPIFATPSFAAKAEPVLEPLALVGQLDVDKIDLDSVVCPTIKCARTGVPICARRMGKLVLFPTSCALASFVCATGNYIPWKREKLEVCAKWICPVKCNATKKYSVYASYGKKTKKFKSECEFRNYACKNYRKPWSRESYC